MDPEEQAVFETWYLKGEEAAQKKEAKRARKASKNTATTQGEASTG
jgi:hypothetical protein